MIWGVVVTVFVTVLIAALLAKIGPLDHPRPRSRHQWPIATGGGLAVIAGVMAGLLVYVLLEAPSPGLGRIPWVLAGGVLIALLGALDDVFDFSPYIKLAVQLLVSIAFCTMIARVEVLPFAPGYALDVGPILGILGTTLWLIVMMNAYNFMDGSDGLAVGVQSIGLFTLALVNPDRPLVAFALLAAAAANIVFLPFNHPGKRLFQGDCGALFSSFIIASATVLQSTGNNPRVSMYIGVFVAAPFITDVLLTLLARARAGRRLFQAHNEHLYQRWLRVEGRTTGDLAWRVWGLTAACATLGFVVDQTNSGWSLPVLLALFAGLAVAWFLMDKRVAPLDPAPVPVTPAG
ncbi:glycosyltransferase family 4 protein [Brevundimonas sp.]|uniref:glycosyltransferase family 4 protein n=1 Tax=Brevundimonas sp. TaxID=1871086 RepID=UPI0025EA3625|nr:MraY family glycosyltransferase [Brevundimonas sp.]